MADTQTPEPQVQAKELQPGEVFRFAEDGFEECLKTDGFWMKVADPSKDKDGKVYAVSLDGKITRVFDADRRVIKHEAVISIKSN